jgi:hypothetical protein
MSKVHSHAYVVDEKVFRFVLEMEVRKALRIQYPLVVLTIVRLTPTATTGSAGLADVGSIAEPLSRIIRGGDLIGLVPESPALRVLLVGAYLEDADGVIERIRAEVPLEATLRFGVACFLGTVTTVEELLGRADVGAGLVPRSAC